MEDLPHSEEVIRHVKANPPTFDDVKRYAEQLVKSHVMSKITTKVLVHLQSLPKTPERDRALTMVDKIQVDFKKCCSCWRSLNHDITVFRMVPQAYRKDGTFNVKTVADGIIAETIYDIEQEKKREACIHNKAHTDAAIAKFPELSIYPCDFITDTHVNIPKKRSS